MLDELRSRQAGVVSRAQALGCGLTASWLRARVSSGQWQRQRPYAGVYVTYSGPISRASWLWAALLRCGPDAMFSHETAAELDGLIDRPGRVIHVTVPRTRRLAAPRGSVSTIQGEWPRPVIRRVSRPGPGSRRRSSI